MVISLSRDYRSKHIHRNEGEVRNSGKPQQEKNSGEKMLRVTLLLMENTPAKTSKSTPGGTRM